MCRERRVLMYSSGIYIDLDRKGKCGLQRKIDGGNTMRIFGFLEWGHVCMEKFDV
jgi:hypothetical protein